MAKPCCHGRLPCLPLHWFVSASLPACPRRMASLTCTKACSIRVGTAECRGHGSALSRACIAGFRGQCDRAPGQPEHWDSNALWLGQAAARADLDLLSHHHCACGDGLRQSGAMHALLVPFIPVETRVAPARREVHSKMLQSDSQIALRERCRECVLVDEIYDSHMTVRRSEIV